MTRNQLQMALHTKKFEDERLQQEARAAALEASEVAALQAEAADEHAQHRTRVLEKRQFMKEWEQQGRRDWRANQTVKQVRVSCSSSLVCFITLPSLTLCRTGPTKTKKTKTTNSNERPRSCGTRLACRSGGGG